MAGLQALAEITGGSNPCHGVELASRMMRTTMLIFSGPPGPVVISDVSHITTELYQPAAPAATVLDGWPAPKASP
jgi:hypothetical protein